MHARGTAAAAALVLGLTGGAGFGGEAVPIQSVTVFGDSLSDVGTYGPATGDTANPGRFTVNPEPIWVQGVAGYYGLAVSPDRALTMDRTASSGATTADGTARVIGGNGYAEGGARVSRLPSQSGVGNNRLVAPVKAQLERYLADHHDFGADALVLIDGGTNDVYAQFSALCYGTDDNGVGAGKTTLAMAGAEIARAADDLVAAVRAVKERGAGVVLVAGAFDWTVTPFGLRYVTADRLATDCPGAVAPEQVAQWTAAFNRAVEDGVSGMPGVVYFDLDRVVGAVIANPASYGIRNVTDTGCSNTKPTSSAVFCTAATLAAPDAGEAYLWSDSFHPSPRLHRVLAERALAELAPLATR